MLASAIVNAADKQPESSPMSAPCIKKVIEPYRWEGYNDKLVDACLGPTHYRIPANYFRDQMGPDFQANFSLMVQWPDLIPLPPGERQKASMEMWNHTITISPDYIDRVPIETILGKSVDSPYNFSFENVGQRDKLPPRFNLTPYYVNAEKLRAYNLDDERKFGYPSRISLERQDDWYLAHDANGRLTTAIKCTSHLEPDGFVLQGTRLVNDGSPRTAMCDHKFVIAESKLLISVTYRRILLKDWKRLEDYTRALFSQFQVR